MFGKSTTGLASVESLQKQVSDSVSLFTTVRNNLTKACEKLAEQINLRDAEIEKLSNERESLDQLRGHSEKVISKIDKILD
jgi:hypothetical protein